MAESVSIIIPSFNAADTIAACLSSVLRQSEQQPLEVIVVDSSTDGTAALIRSHFPGVQLVSSPSRLYPGAARNIGAARARGTLLAFLDADCTVAPNFVEEVSRFFAQERHPVFAGTLHNGNPRSYVGWGYYFCAFSKWAPRLSPTPLPLSDAPSGCLVIARAVFVAHGPFSEERFCEDTTLSWRLARAGLRPWLAPSIGVHHTNIDRVGLLWHRRFRHGRAFAQARQAERRLTPGGRLIRVLGAPLVPALLLGRSARSIFAGQRYRREFVWALPVTLLGHVAWALGELAEYASTRWSRP